MSGRCSICQELFDPDEISALKCGHTFHLVCISHWFTKSASCPVCRRPAHPQADLVQQLYFDYGQDSVASDFSPSTPSFAKRTQILTKRVQELELTLKGKEKLIAALEQERKAEVRMLTTSISGLKKQVQEQVREKTELQKKLKLFKQISEFVNDMDGDENSYADLDGAYQLSLAILKKQINTYASENQRLTERTKELERKNDAQEMQIEQLKRSRRVVVASAPESDSSVSSDESEDDPMENACQVYKLRSIKTSTPAVKKGKRVESNSERSDHSGASFLAPRVLRRRQVGNGKKAEPVPARQTGRRQQPADKKKKAEQSAPVIRQATPYPGEAPKRPRVRADSATVTTKRSSPKTTKKRVPRTTKGQRHGHDQETIVLSE